MIPLTSLTPLVPLIPLIPLSFSTNESKSPVRVLAIGDPHFKKGNTRETSLMGPAIIKLAQQLQPDFIVNLGDTQELFDNIHPRPLTESVEWMAELVKIAPLYVLIGNHDIQNNKDYFSKYHPYAALKYWPQTTVVDQCLSITVKGQKFILCPYVYEGLFSQALLACDLPRDQALIKRKAPVDVEQLTKQLSGVSAIFAHQEFLGAQMGPYLSTAGDVWPENYPYIVSGHMHEHHFPQANIHYTGTPIQHEFGSNTDKGVTLFTFHSWQQREYVRYPLPVPLKKILHLSYSQVPNYQLPATDCHYKIVISGTASELAVTMKHANVKAWRRLGHRVGEKTLVTTVNVDKILVTKKSFSATLADRVASHPRLLGVYEETLGRYSICGIPPEITTLVVIEGRYSVNGVSPGIIIKLD